MTTAPFPPPPRDFAIPVVKALQGPRSLSPSRFAHRYAKSEVFPDSGRRHYVYLGDHDPLNTRVIASPAVQPRSNRETLMAPQSHSFRGVLENSLNTSPRKSLRSIRQAASPRDSLFRSTLANDAPASPRNDFGTAALNGFMSPRDSFRSGTPSAKVHTSSRDLFDAPEKWVPSRRSLSRNTSPCQTPRETAPSELPTASRRRLDVPLASLVGDVLVDVTRADSEMPEWNFHSKRVDAHRNASPGLRGIMTGAGEDTKVKRIRGYGMNESAQAISNAVKSLLEGEFQTVCEKLSLNEVGPPSARQEAHQATRNDSAVSAWLHPNASCKPNLRSLEPPPARRRPSTAQNAFRASSPILTGDAPVEGGLTFARTSPTTASEHIAHRCEVGRLQLRQCSKDPCSTIFLPRNRGSATSENDGQRRLMELRQCHEQVAAAVASVAAIAPLALVGASR